MKHGKRLKRRHYELLKKAGLNPENWLITKDLQGEVHLSHRLTGKERVLK